MSKYQCLCGHLQQKHYVGDGACLLCGCPFFCSEDDIEPVTETPE